MNPIAFYSLFSFSLLSFNLFKRKINRHANALLTNRRFCHLTAVVSLLLGSMSSSAATVFINEFHYDNQGSDIDEGVEIVAPAGTSMQDWKLLFYNGGSGDIYKIENLSGMTSDQNNGYGSLAFQISGLQNGPADAIALVDNNDSVVEFISYEGSMLALSGAAAGLQSTDIGLEESTSATAGFSLQRTGTGIQHQDFNWQLQVSSFGDINIGQNFSSTAVPVPAGYLLYLSAISLGAVIGTSGA